MAKDNPEREPGDVNTGERMAHLASAMGTAAVHRISGESQTEDGPRHTVAASEAQAVISDWPDAPKKGAQQMMQQYGPPNEATPTKLFWYRNGPWKRTMVTRDAVEHNFPAPHGDYLTQYVDYRVPAELFDKIGYFDGSCLVDRTSGEVAARCDTEAANFITINLMHEIVTGKRSVDQARHFYAEAMAAYAMGRSSPYAEGLLFQPPQEDTADPDEAMMAGAAARQMAGKVRDVVSGTKEQVDGPPENRPGAGGAEPRIGDYPRNPVFNFEKSQ
jgi:hypothetical protein